jgi:hypothetical protein
MHLSLDHTSDMPNRLRHDRVLLPIRVRTSSIALSMFDGGHVPVQAIAGQFSEHERPMLTDRGENFAHTLGNQNPSLCWTAMETIHIRISDIRRPSAGCLALEAS